MDIKHNPDFDVVEVKVFGEITRHSFEMFYDDFTAAQDTGVGTIRIVISSEGGDVASLKGMLALMESADQHIETRAIGICGSCAFVLLVSGDHRSVYKGTDLLSHRISGETEGSPEQVRSALRYYERIQDELINIVTHKSKLDKKFVSDNLFKDTDTWLTPDEALSAGLVDEIL